MSQSQAIRIIGVNNMTSKDINELTEIYLSNPSLPSAKMLEILQQRLACKSANEQIQIIRQEHQYLLDKSFYEKQQKLHQLRTEAESLLAYPRSINSPNPSYFLSINTLHEELKFAKAQVKNCEDSIDKVKNFQSDFKSALRTSFYLSGNEPDKKTVDELLDEIGIKECLNILQEEEKKWQDQVNKLKLELAGLPIVTLHRQSNLETFQDNNHNNGDTNDDTE